MCNLFNENGFNVNLKYNFVLSTRNISYYLLFLCDFMQPIKKRVLIAKVQNLPCIIILFWHRTLV